MEGKKSNILDNIILPKTEVFGLSRYRNKNGDTDHVAIYPAKVESVTISINKKTGEDEITYWLMTPEGKVWGSDVSSKDVALTREELLKKIIPEWDLGWKDIEG